MLLHSQKGGRNQECGGPPCRTCPRGIWQTAANDNAVCWRTKHRILFGRLCPTKTVLRKRNAEWNVATRRTSGWALSSQSDQSSNASCVTSRMMRHVVDHWTLFTHPVSLPQQLHQRVGTGPSKKKVPTRRSRIGTVSGRSMDVTAQRPTSDTSLMRVSDRPQRVAKTPRRPKKRGLQDWASDRS